MLLDGLDEVARDEDRRLIADWIERQVAAYPDNHFVVTSRPHGYRTAVIAPALVLQARPFTAEQVERFLRSWYQAAERHATGTAGQEAQLRADSGARDLLERLASAPALHDLTVNPLLLTMIANVHRYRGALPGSRADLYGEMCQVMLWRRAEAKRQAVVLPGPTKQRLLAQLAYEMMEAEVRDLPRGLVLAALRPGLGRVSGAPSAEDVLADVAFNGLLVEREKDLYSFAHHTFQEYLAATHIRDRNLIRTLTRAVDEVWWRETTLLYCATGDADPIVRTALSEGTVTALSLAFDCAESAELAPELRDRLEATLDAAFATDAQPELRRLLAGILAARHVTHLVPTSSGSRICQRPVPADLYRLFVNDTGARPPDGHYPPGPRQPGAVTGIWADDATKFVDWVNSLDMVSDDAVYRLPTPAELEHCSAANVWATSDSGSSRPKLWTAPGQQPTNRLADAQLLNVVVDDVLRIPAAVQLVIAAAYARAYTIDRALEITLDDKPTLGLTKTLGSTIDQLLEAAVALNVVIADRDRVPDLDHIIDNAHTLIGSFSGGHNPRVIHDHAHRLTGILAFALVRTLRRASTIADDLSLRGTIRHAAASALQGSEKHVPSVIRGRDIDDVRAYAVDHKLTFELDRAFDDVLSQATSPPSFPIYSGHRDGYVDLTGLRKICHRIDSVAVGDGFAHAMSVALTPARDRTPFQFANDFANDMARVLVRNAGIADGGTLVEFDELALAAVDQVMSVTYSSPGGWWAASATDRLHRNLAAIHERGQMIAPSQAAPNRLTALALAASARGESARYFRMAAAGITLLQQRPGDAESLESIILARV